MRTWDELMTDGFWQRLCRSRERVLFLDYDGTLAPFVEDRDKAAPYPGVATRIRRIARPDGKPGRTRVVFVSGRAVEDVLRLAGLEDLRGGPGAPGVEVFGSHGGERLDATGAVQPLFMEPRQERGLGEAAAWVRETGMVQRLELKPGCVAYHVRGDADDDAEAFLNTVRAAWEPLAADSGLALHAFDGGLELRLPGRDKGAAVETFLDGMATPVACAYLGDDATDEDAFARLDDLSLRHASLTVATCHVRAEPKASRAGWLLRPPEDLLAFLDRWAATA